MLESELARHFERLAQELPPLAPEASPLVRRLRYWGLAAHASTHWPDRVTVNDVAVATAVGRVPVRLFYGHDGRDEPVPTIVYFPGGGWVCGNPDTHASLCARLAYEANALVAAVDVPKAPEATWQQITETCHAAAEAIAADRARAAPATPLVLAGDSAGGHLAAVTSITARDRESFHVVLAALFCPCIEPDFTTASYERFAETPGLTRAEMQWYWRQYAGPDIGLNDYRIAPTRAASLAGLPPMYVVTGGCDPLADDGRSWSEALRAHGVEVTHEAFEGMPHGFLRLAKFSAAADAALQHVGARLGQLLRNACT
ncbi:MAG: alpha/beta hydrolase [Casimicrobiaceae bacterium]|nr:alpha/beta hydrolase [Casimicrobiaceae bacterium]MDW8311201.1 alpha/beta hydrolase [Burkholderiales bacterium]